MGALDEITQMRNQRMSDNEIVNSLRGRFSPRDIQDALNQAQIKNAVSREFDDSVPSPTSPDQNTYGGYNQNPQIIEEDYPAEPPQQDYYSPQPAQQQEYYPQEQSGYEDYSGAYAGAAGGTDTMMEIAEQVYSQKIKKLQKQVEELTEFKTLASTKIDLALERLKRIEATMDKLQSAIIEKVGSYGSTLQSIKKEMSMMQDSFGKVVDKAVHGHKK